MVTIRLIQYHRYGTYGGKALNGASQLSYGIQYRRPQDLIIQAIIDVFGSYGKHRNFRPNVSSSIFSKLIFAFWVQGYLLQMQICIPHFTLIQMHPHQSDANL
jgi:hypothetical protein